MIDVKGKSVYISGPMTGYRNHNVAAFCDAHATLKELGAREVFNPAMAYLQSTRKLSHETWMLACIHELSSYGAVNAKPKYDLLVKLPGWEESEGALAEAAVAGACGIEARELDEVLG